MLTGNLLSYAFIAFIMITKTGKDPDEVKTEIFNYISNRQQFILLDGSKMQIDTCSIKVSYNKDGKRLNDTKSKGYNLYIPFTKQPEGGFQFQFRIVGDKYAGGINDNSKDLHFIYLKNEYEIVLEQKNPDTAFGWTKPIITDTLVFKQISKRN